MSKSSIEEFGKEITRKLADDLEEGQSLPDDVIDIINRVKVEMGFSPRPPQSFTIKEFALETGIPQSTVARNLRLMVENGELNVTTIAKRNYYTLKE